MHDALWLILNQYLIICIIKRIVLNVILSFVSHNFAPKPFQLIETHTHTRTHLKLGNFSTCTHLKTILSIYMSQLGDESKLLSNFELHYCYKFRRYSLRKHSKKRTRDTKPNTRYNIWRFKWWLSYCEYFSLFQRLKVQLSASRNCNYRFRNFNVFFWFSQALAHMLYIHSLRSTHTHIK